jgi:hypothetical protein
LNIEGNTDVAFSNYRVCRIPKFLELLRLGKVGLPDDRKKHRLAEAGKKM